MFMPTVTTRAVSLGSFSCAAVSYPVVKGRNIRYCWELDRCRCDYRWPHSGDLVRVWSDSSWSIPYDNGEPSQMVASIQPASEVGWEEPSEWQSYSWIRVGLLPMKSVRKPPSDLMKIMGRLQFRTSYGQNVLRHSIRLPNFLLCASEVGWKCYVWHDVFRILEVSVKRLLREVEGSHVELGELAFWKYKGIRWLSIPLLVTMVTWNLKVSSQLCRCSGCLECSSTWSTEVEVAKATSNVLQDLEEIANSFEGVKTKFRPSSGSWNPYYG